MGSVHLKLEILERIPHIFVSIGVIRTLVASKGPQTATALVQIFSTCRQVGQKKSTAAAARRNSSPERMAQRVAQPPPPTFCHRTDSKLLLWALPRVRGHSTAVHS